LVFIHSPAASQRAQPASDKLQGQEEERAKGLTPIYLRSNELKSRYRIFGEIEYHKKRTRAVRKNSQGHGVRGIKSTQLNTGGPLSA